MPRKLRIQYPGALYYLSSQAGPRKKAFLNREDRQDFLNILGETCRKTGFQVHAFCLLEDSYHLVVETPKANLAAGMAWMQSAYTIRFNVRHGRSGAVFRGRYRTVVIENNGDGWFRAACDAVHLKPVQTRLLDANKPLASYPWSSLGLYLVSREHRPLWLRTDRLRQEHGFAQDSQRTRVKLEADVEAQRAGLQTQPKAADLLRRGWYLGSRKFRTELLNRMLGKQAARSTGMLRTKDRTLAREILKTELRRRGWEKGELRNRRKSDPEKLAIAARLRRETTLSVSEIAGLVHLGVPSGAKVVLHRWMSQHPTA
jgi:REP element-mobilizing transposase RayT